MIRNDQICSKNRVNGDEISLFRVFGRGARRAFAQCDQTIEAVGHTARVSSSIRDHPTFYHPASAARITFFSLANELCACVNKNCFTVVPSLFLLFVFAAWLFRTTQIWLFNSTSPFHVVHPRAQGPQNQLNYSHWSDDTLIIMSDAPSGKLKEQDLTNLVRLG